MTNHLSLIIDQLHDEHPPRLTRLGKRCKHCGCCLAVAREESTIYHKRNFVSNIVEVVTAYYGKFECQMCHRYQA